MDGHTTVLDAVLASMQNLALGFEEINMARPTKYKEQFCDEVEVYLKTAGREQTKLPTVSEFSRYIGINGDTLVEWGKKYPKFSAAIKRLKEHQKEQLMNDGLYGGKEVNSTMAIFLLKANHDMIETDRIIGDPKLPVAVVVLPKLNEDIVATPSRPADQSTKKD